MNFKIGDKLVCVYVGGYSGIDIGDKAFLTHKSRSGSLTGETEKGTSFGIPVPSNDEHWEIERIKWRDELK